jgi:hypothetical protein
MILSLGSFAASFQSKKSTVAPGSLFALLQSMGTAPSSTGIVTGVIVGFTSLTIFSIIRGPEAILHSFMHLTSSIPSTISTITREIRPVVERTYDIVKPAALALFDLIRVMAPIIFGFFFVIFGVIRDTVLGITGVFKAILVPVKDYLTTRN